MSSLLFSVYKLGRESTQLENMCDINKGFYKKLTKNHLSRSLFFNEVRCCISATSFKTRLQYSLFCEFWEICKNTFFAEHHQTTASDYSRINRSEGELAGKTVNYDTKIKAKLSYQKGPSSWRNKFNLSDSCFWRTSPEQNLMWLSAVYTKVNWKKKYFLSRKSPPQWKVYQR